MTGSCPREGLWRILEGRRVPQGVFQLPLQWQPKVLGDASQILCLKPPAWLRDDQPPPWSAARNCSRFMVQPREWSEEFDGAYLGLVEEFGDEVASGFGGAVKQARWADFVVASKRFYRGDAELFAELYFGLLIGASPVIGFGVTAEGHGAGVSVAAGNFTSAREAHGLNRSRVPGGKQALCVTCCSLFCLYIRLAWCMGT